MQSKLKNKHFRKFMRLRQIYILIASVVASLAIQAVLALPASAAIYVPQGIATSTNLLSGSSAASINNFHYNISSLPVTSSVRIQFSQDNSSWYSSNGTSGGWDPLTTTGGADLSLSALGWSGAAFYYKIELNSTSDLTGTPAIDDIRLDYTPSSGYEHTFVYDNNGNVGIGDATPDSILDIFSSSVANTQLTITNTNAGDYDTQIGFQLVEGTNLFTMGVDDSDSDKFKISTSGLGTNDRLVIDSSGNVGIGDTTPDAKLDIDSTSTTGADFLITNTGIGTTGAIAGITANSVTTGDLLTVSGNGLTTGSAIKVVSTSAGLTSGSLLNISSSTTGAVATNGIVSLTALGAYTSTSNIGLLTVKANATLTGTIQRIEGNALTSGTALSIASSSAAFTGNLADLTLSGSNAANTGSVLSLTNNGALNTGSTFYVKHYATGTNNLAMRVDDESGDTSPFVIDGTGAVGIGTTSPASKLEISENAATTALTVTQSGTGNIVNLTGDSITTGTGLTLSVDGLTTGSGLAIDSTSTAFNGGKLLNLTASGALGSAGTVYGVYSALTGANANNTNIAGYFSASGAGSTNYGLIVENGNAGIGTTAPINKVEINGSLGMYANLGSDKVTDGDFTGVAPGGWTVGAGWTYDGTNDEADRAVAAATALEQNVSAVANEIYKVVYTVQNWVAGSVTVSVGGASGIARSANGAYLEYITATGAGNLQFTPSADANLSVDTVSVKKAAKSAADQVAFWIDDRGNVAGKGGLYMKAEDGTTHVFGDQVGIGTASPGRKFDILDNSNPQMRLTYDASNRAEFQVNGTGVLTITTAGTGTDVIVYDDNLQVCASGCPAITMTGTGNIQVEGDIYAAGGYKNSFNFAQSNTTASQTAVAIDVLGLTGNTEYVLPYAGSIIGISVASNVACEAGNLTVDATINGAVTGLQAALESATNTTYHSAVQGVNTDVFSAGNRLGVKITTDAVWQPTTADIVVTVTIEY